MHTATHKNMKLARNPCFHILRGFLVDMFQKSKKGNRREQYLCNVISKLTRQTLKRTHFS